MLDKFIPGNIDWVVRFVECKDKKCIKVVGAKGYLAEKEDNSRVPLIDQITVSVLKVTTLVSEKLYFRK